MRGNRFLDVLAGLILGVLFGTLYYAMPTKCLLTGTIPVNGLFLPKGVQSAILLLSLKWGGSIGAAIGFLGGLSCPITMPRGHMSKGISCTSFFICTIVAFVMHGGQLWYMAGWKIGATFFYVFVFFVFTIPIGQLFSFIEKIRE